MSHRYERNISYEGAKARHGICSDSWSDSVRRNVLSPQTTAIKKAEPQEPKVVIKEIHHHYAASQASGCLLPLALAATFGMVTILRHRS